MSRELHIGDAAPGGSLLRRGVDRATAEAIWANLAALASYGFAENHAVSFALLACQSACLKRYDPLE